MDGRMASAVCRTAGRILGGGSAGSVAQDAEARALLDALDYGPPDDNAPVDSAPTANRIALLRLAGRTSRLFRVPSPDAPNLVFLGGEVEAMQTATTAAVSLAGAGLTLRDAFERCIGEGAEYLSQVATEADIVARGRPSDVDHGHDDGTLSDLLARLTTAADVESAFDWVAGRCLATDRPVLLPAGLCLRRADAGGRDVPRVAAGIGCAAGVTPQSATLAAVLEVIERDAAALWWSGGRPPRPIARDTDACDRAAALLGRLRGGVSTRCSWLLDITTDLGVPCVASVSLSGSGAAFACGLSAGLTVAAAAESAILEMCQMELAHHVVAAKRRQRGDAALNAQDRAHDKRGRLVNADCGQIQPKGPPNDWQLKSEYSTQRQFSFDEILRRMQEMRVRLFEVNLTRDSISIPVSKIIACGLQPYPSEFETPRLVEVMKRHGRRKKPGLAVPLL